MAELADKTLFTHEMQSRRERKKERTRQEIYNAAIALFLERGFDSVTVDDICRSADVAKGTFFLHFPTKDAVLSEYGRGINEDLSEIIREHRGGATSQLRAALGLLAERAVKNTEVVRLLVGQVLASPGAFDRNFEQTRDLASQLASIIERGQRSSEFRRTIDPRIAALVVSSAFFGFILEWSRRGGALNIEPAIDQTLDIVLSGLTDRKP